MIETDEKSQDKTSNTTRKKNWKEYIVPILLICIVIELGMMINTLDKMKYYLYSVDYEVSAMKTDVSDIQSDVAI